MATAQAREQCSSGCLCQLITGLVPAAPSSPVPAVLAKLGPLHQHDTGCLRAHLQRVPDPRSRRGRWYPLIGLLLICACAVVSGARTITEITEWGQRATEASPGATLLVFSR
ncbi:transposase family protein [Streptomyces mirabilis]